MTLLEELTLLSKDYFEPSQGQEKDTIVQRMGEIIEELYQLEQREIREKEAAYERARVKVASTWNRTVAQL